MISSIKWFNFQRQNLNGKITTLKAWSETKLKVNIKKRKILKKSIKKLLKIKKAVLIAHYYVNNDLQDIAEETGGCVADSLEMARFGKYHNFSTIIIAGVKFMGETAKIISPKKKILMLDINATCSLELGCNFNDFNDFCNKHPERIVVVYANTNALIKARADWMVTSSIALDVINFLHNKGKKIIWAPDKYLGNYIKLKTKADMLIWNSSCIVHEEFKNLELKLMKKKYPDALVLVHPESPIDIISQADIVGSTSQLILASQKYNVKKFIVATDKGILHKMKLLSPEKIFFMAPTAGNSATCKSCTHCPWMEMNNLIKLEEVLKINSNEIKIDTLIAKKAKKCIKKMLNFSKNFKNKLL
ncbi:quinolinate synthase NadA [Candidatus Zinderia endosymbiont of Aphrophora alni]|uniref:quinolinate synthase NadA n=1 Tax=Candidatus Zinderia endosymbiont of Aphrophora alni TaxID=3077951 RepID=UPI0030D3EBE6